MAELEPVAAARPEDFDLQLALADAYASTSNVRADLGQPAEALELGRKRLGVVEALARSRPTSSVVQHNRLGAAQTVASILVELGGVAEALEVLQGAVATARALVANNPTSIPALGALYKVQNGLGLQQFAVGRVADALATMEASAGTEARILQLDPRDLWHRRELAGTKYNIGFLRRELGDQAAALAAYEEALAMQLALDREHPDDPRFAFDAATTLGNIGAIHVIGGESARGQDAQARAVGLLGRLVAAHRENATYRSYLARARTNLASSLIDLGDLDGAGALLAEADAAAERLAADQPKVVQNWADVGAVRQIRGSLDLRRGLTDEAVTWYLRAIEAFWRAVEGRPNDPDQLGFHAHCVVKLADLLNRLGRPAEAVEPLARAADGLSAALARDPGAGHLKSILASVLRSRAEAMARLGRAREAADTWSAPRHSTRPTPGSGWARR